VRVGRGGGTSVAVAVGSGVGTSAVSQAASIKVAKMSSDESVWGFGMLT